MSTRNIFYLFTFIVIFLTLTSCGNDDELTYPVTYTFNNDIEFEDFLLFKLTDTGQEEIAITGRLADIEPIVRQEVIIGASEDAAFNQITLLSEDQMLFFDENRPTDSFFIDYTQLSATLFRADVSGNGTETFELMLTNNNSELKFCNESFAYFRQTPISTNESGLDSDFCDFSQSIDDAVNDIRINNDLIANDTVFYNRSNIIFTRD